MAATKKTSGPAKTSRAGRPTRMDSDVLSKLSGIPAGKESEAQAIQKSVVAGLKPDDLHPLGLWSGGCYYVASGRPTKKYKYGRYWRLVKCLA